MLKKKIVVQYHYIPINQFKVLKKKLNLIGTQKYYESAVSLPIYYDLSFKKQMYIIQSIFKFFKKKFKKKNLKI